MRIIALGDIHRAYEKAENIIAKESDSDLIIISGDVTTHGSVEEAKSAITNFMKYGKRILAISGNMDSPQIDMLLEQMGCSINGKGIVVGEVGFFGISSAPISVLNTPYEITEDEIFSIAEKGWQEIKNARWKIMVTHSPPFNTKLDQIFLGKHVGSKSVSKFISQYNPDAVICGHIHEARGKDKIGNAQIVNCGPASHGYYACINIKDMITIENCQQ